MKERKDARKSILGSERYLKIFDGDAKARRRIFGELFGSGDNLDDKKINEITIVLKAAIDLFIKINKEGQFEISREGARPILRMNKKDIETREFLIDFLTQAVEKITEFSTKAFLKFFYTYRTRIENKATAGLKDQTLIAKEKLNLDAFFMMLPRGETEKSIKLLEKIASAIEYCYLRVADNQASQKNEEKEQRWLEETSRVANLFKNILGMNERAGFGFSNLIEGIKKGDQKYRELLKRLFYLLEIMGLEPLFVSGSGNSSSILRKKNGDGESDEYFIEIPFVSMENLGVINNTHKEYTEERELKLASLIELTDWFKENFDFFKEDFDLFWKNITEAKRLRFIRDNGLDVIKIKIPALNEMGYTHLQFINEETEFPNVNVKFWINKDEKGRIKEDKPIEKTLNLGQLFSLNFHLEKEKNILNYGNIKNDENGESGNSLEYLNFLLVYIAMDCYQHIILNKDFPVKRSERLRSIKERKKSRGDGEKTIFIRRRHARKLAEGQNASAEALARFAEVSSGLVSLPSGVTFVREHRVEKGSTAGEKGSGRQEEITPIFEYGVKELGCY